MNTTENGYSDSKPYYLPASHAQNIRRYRQCSPPGDDLLGIEVFDYLVISVLQITGLSSLVVDIQSVHVDAAFPLRVMVKNTDDLFSQADYPLRLVYGSSLSLLLNVHTASGCFQDFCYPAKPRKVVVTTNLGPVEFETEE